MHPVAWGPVSLITAALVTGCAFEVPLGFHDGGTCGAPSVGGLGLDPSFGTCGTVIIDLGGVANVGSGTRGLALDAQGRALLAGTSGTPADRNFAVVRLLESGALDPSFGVGGVGELTLTAGDHGEGLLVQPDGLVVLAGGAALSGGGEPIAVLGRLLPSGLPDPSFGIEGHVKVGVVLGSTGVCNGVLRRSDGALLCSGTMWRAFPDQSEQVLLARTASSEIEPSFGVMSAALVDYFGTNDTGGVAVTTAEEKLLLPGTTFSGTSNDFTLTRLDSNGVPDPSFTDARGRPGQVGIDFQGGDDECRTALSGVDGTAWCAGTARVDGAQVGALVRVLPSGVLDPSFGTGGRVVLNEWRVVSAVLPLDGGRFLIGGSAATASGDLALALQVLDVTGAAQGALTTMDLTGTDDAVRSLVMDERGRVWVLGVANDGTGNNDFVVQRFVGESKRLGVAGECSASGGAPLLLLAVLVGRRKRKSRSPKA